MRTTLFETPSRLPQLARWVLCPFGYFSEAEVDRLTAQQSVTPDLEERRELVQEADLLTSDKVAGMFVLPGKAVCHPKGGQLPAASRIPDLVDLDLVTVEG